MATRYKGEIFSPMKAMGFRNSDPKRHGRLERLFADNNYVGQRKMNGERILLYKMLDGGSYTLHAHGRNRTRYNQHIDKSTTFGHLLQQLDMHFPDMEVVIDGEVVWFDPALNLSLEEIKAIEFSEDFEQLSKFTRHKDQSKNVANQLKYGFLHFIIWDVLVYKSANITQEPYMHRLRILDHIRDNHLSECKYMHVLPIVQGEYNKRKLYEDLLAEGLEGVILKNIYSLYTGKKSAYAWYKAKKSEAHDCVILGYLAPREYNIKTSGGLNVLDETGNYVKQVSKYAKLDWIGSVLCGQYVPKANITDHMTEMYDHYMESGEMQYFRHNIMIDNIEYCLMPVGRMSGFNENLREQFSNDRQGHLGKIIAVECFETTSDGFMRHARFLSFRHDKDVEECIRIEKIEEDD